MKAYLRVGFFIGETKMLIKINGTESEISDNLSIQDLISARDLPGNVIIIELNGVILRRELWESTKFNPNDNVEIIRLIGGG